MRHERVVIIKNMFHPMDFEVGSSILTGGNIDTLSFKGARSSPRLVFLMSHLAHFSSRRSRKRELRISRRLRIFPGLALSSFHCIPDKPV